jgi:hypothetical protein
MSQLTTTDRRGFAPATITEAMEFSKMLADSSMVPRAYQGKPQDIMVCVQWGYEIGLAPMQALQNIAVINGKPSVYGDAAMALVQASPVCEGVEEFFEGEGTPNPIAVCVAHRRGRKPVTAKFSVEDAKRAGLWGKTGPWQAYPKRMMQMRARGFALRDAFPDVLKGLITAEEAQDYPDEAKPRQAKDITPRNPLDVVAAPQVGAVISDPVAIANAMADTVDVDEPVAVPEPVAAPVAEPDPVKVTTECSKCGGGTGQENPCVCAVNAIQQQAEEAGLAVVDIPEVVAESVPAEDDDIGSIQPVGYALRVPGKDEPASVHQSLDEWQDAYEDMADKIAKAGKRPARERMTILREFKECNERVIERVDMVKRIRHTAAYSRRIKALGASQ